MLARFPIRWRLTLWYALLLAIGFLIFGAVLYGVLRYRLHHAFDQQLRTQAAVTLAAVHFDDDGLTLGVAATASEDDDNFAFVRLLDRDGQEIAASVDQPDWETPTSDLTEAALRGETRLSSAQFDGDTIRVITTPVLRDGRIVGVLQLGLSREETDEVLAELLATLLVVMPLALAGTIAGGYALARRALAPVDAITGLAAGIGGDELGERLRLDLPDDELGRLAATFDAMLERIETAFERQRRFTADAAHELRTPLSAMRSEVDLALARPRSAEEYRAALGGLEGDLDRLTGVVHGLLTLARADADRLAAGREAVDLAETIGLVLDQYAEAAAAAGVSLSDAASPAVAWGDEDQIVQILVNLVANAVAHTGPGGTVTVGCDARGERVRLWVEDSGVGIAPEHIKHVFDRFYRVDHGRTRTAGGTGLGLSITKTLVEANGGTITLTSTVGRGTRVEVTLPGAAATT
jgi:heavy metal sensor kinase